MDLSHLNDEEFKLVKDLIDILPKTNGHLNDDDKNFVTMFIWLHKPISNEGFKTFN